MKKIHLIFDKFYPEIGGVQIYMKEAHTRLIELGWDVVVHCINTKPNTLLNHEKVEEIDVNRYSFRKYKLWPFGFKLSFFEDSVISLQEFCIFPHYLIYVFTILLKLVGRKKYKLILSSHGLFSNDISQYPGISRKIKRIIDVFLGVILVNMSVDQIHAISRVEKNALIQAGIKPSLIKDIFYGLDPVAHTNIDGNSSDKVKEQVKSFTPYIIQMGRIDRYKNYEAVIRALPLIPSQIKYLIVGPPNDQAYLKELNDLIKKLDVGDRVVFTGPVLGPDKFYLLKNALLYIHLAFSEGFGMVVLEAKSQGTIGIVSKNTGMEEMIKDNINGYTVNWNETDLIVQKIRFVLDNYSSSVIMDMKNRNIQDTKNITWEKSAERLQNLILELN